MNALASLSQDSNPTVRGRTAAVLAFFCVCLPDRYDHHTRLLPYLVSFYTDDVEKVRVGAEILGHIDIYTLG